MPSPRKPQPAQRREQGEFSKEEKKFLNTHLPLYLGSFGSGSESKKGDKKEWVLEKVYPKFLAEFDSAGPNGPNLDSLKTKMVRYFTNRRPTNHISKAPPVVQPKTPRATSARDIFAMEKKAEIKERMAEKRDDGTAPGDNLTLYKQARDELWDEIAASSRASFEGKSLSRKEAIIKGPQNDDIERNRENVVANTVDALRPLVGAHWTGHGDIVFFVQGAFRSSKVPHKLHTFSASVGPMEDFEGFHLSVENFKDDFQAPFKKWARKTLPEVVFEPEIIEATSTAPDAPPAAVLTITLLEDGFPKLPDIDVNDITPKDAKRLLSEYITTAWATVTSKGKSNAPVPWDALNSMTRGKILDNPIPFVAFKSLDPSHASASDVYGVLGTILEEQEKGEHPLKFSVDRETLYCMSTDPKTVDASTGSSNVRVKSVSPGKHLPKKKGRKPKKPVALDGEMFDFSPNIPGNVASGKETAPAVPSNDKLLRLSHVEQASPSLHPAAPTHSESPPISHAAPLQPDAGGSRNPEQVPAPTARPMKRKGGTGDNGDKLAPPSKKSKKDKPAPTAKKQSVAVAPVGVVKRGNTKPPPAPRERSKRIHATDYQNANVTVRPRSP